MFATRLITTAMRAHKARGLATAVGLNLKSIAVVPLGALGASEVALKFLAAAIHPTDIDRIGSDSSAVGGSEGVAVVESVGSAVKSLKKGDWVQPTKSGIGTWTQVAKAEESGLMKVPSDLPVEYAATLAGGPSCAYRLLRDFESLKRGDVIIQNGANSMVGMAVIQMAREMGVKTINVVRSDRPELDKTLALLTNLGGDINIPDTFVNSYQFNEIVKDLGPLKLALNCVGGESATNLARVLAADGSLVTYGDMSKQGVALPAEVVANKKLKVSNFSLAQWYDENSGVARSSMVNDVSSLIREKHLTLFYEVHDFDDFNYALKQACEPFAFRKVLLNLDFPDRLKEHDSKTDDDYKMFETSVV